MRGHDVRVLSVPPRRRHDCGGGVLDYPLSHRRVPLVAPLIVSQGYACARSACRQVDRVMILRALRLSSHARSIELTLTQRGSTERRLCQLADRLARGRARTGLSVVSRRKESWSGV